MPEEPSKVWQPAVNNRSPAAAIEELIPHGSKSDSDADAPPDDGRMSWELIPLDDATVAGWTMALTLPDVVTRAG